MLTREPYAASHLTFAIVETDGSLSAGDFPYGLEIT
jgi:hypothetical protein